MNERPMARRRALTGVLAAGAAVAGGLMTAAPAAAATDQDSVVGTWMGACTVSTPNLPALQFLLTFSPNGVLFASTSIDLNPQYLGTPGHGAWQRGTVINQFKAVTFGFAFDPSGIPAGTDIIRLDIKIEDDLMTANVDTVVKDLQGNVIEHITRVLNANRIRP